VKTNSKTKKVSTHDHQAKKTFYNSHGTIPVPEGHVMHRRQGGCLELSSYIARRDSRETYDRLTIVSRMTSVIIGDTGFTVLTREDEKDESSIGIPATEVVSNSFLQTNTRKTIPKQTRATKYAPMRLIR